MILKFLTHNSIDFLSGTALFQYNMKWVSITDSPVLKNVSAANVLCVLVQAVTIFWHNMKWAQKLSLSLAITDSPILKFVSAANVWCALVQTMIVTEKKD